MSERQDDGWCVVVYKVFDPNASPYSYERFVDFLYKNPKAVHIINASYNGKAHYEDESRAVKKFLDEGGIFVAAAGNEGKTATGNEKISFPAQIDKRVVVVGSSAGRQGDSGILTKDLKKPILS